MIQDRFKPIHFVTALSLMGWGCGSGTLSGNFYSGAAANVSAATTTPSQTSGGSTPAPVPSPTPSPTPSKGPGNSATFLNKDTTTLGNWKGGGVAGGPQVYGLDGYWIPDTASSSNKLPAYAGLIVEGPSGTNGAQAGSGPGGSTYECSTSWVTNTAAVASGGMFNLYDLQVTSPSPTDNRQASAWYTCFQKGAETFDLHVTINDGQAHKVAVYALDLAGVTNTSINVGAPREETLQVVDAVSGMVLDALDVSSFGPVFSSKGSYISGGGIYYQWEITGDVKISVTVPSSFLATHPNANAVISGIFFN